MAKKETLLNEGTIRRFMKLAELGPLTETYVEQLQEEEHELEAEDVEIEEKPELDLGDVEAEDDLADAEADVDEAEAELEDAEEEVADVEMREKAEAFLKQAADAMAAAAKEIFDVDVEVETDEEPEMVDADMDMDVDMEDDEMDMDVEVDAEMDAADDDLEGIEVLDDEELMQEVAARVAKRLLALKNQ